MCVSVLHMCLLQFVCVCVCVRVCDANMSFGPRVCVKMFKRVCDQRIHPSLSHRGYTLTQNSLFLAHKINHSSHMNTFPFKHSVIFQSLPH